MKRQILVMAIGGILPASLPAQTFDGVKESIRQHMQAHDIPAVAVAVWQDGRILWEQGFGWADRENRISATEHTTFNLASVSKSLTAVGLMTLVQGGKVDLDAPANDYLGEEALKSWIGDPKAITVRRLLNHTAGLPGGDETFYGEDVRNMPPRSEAVHRYAIGVAPAGERYLYSNFGYGALGVLIERVSGKSFEDFMHRAVFLPLGMTHSAVNLPPQLEKHQAVRYDFDRKPIPYYLSNEPAAGAIYSSAHDMARLGMFLLKDRLADQRAILTERSIDRLTEQPVDEHASPVQPASPKGPGYAQGWGVNTRGGYRLIGHTGGQSGVSTNFRLVPERRLGAVVLTNADDGAGSLCDQLLQSVLKDWRDPPRKVDAEDDSADEAFRPTAALVGTWQGIVHADGAELPMRMKILPSGDIHVRIGEEPRYTRRSTVRQEALLNEAKLEQGVLTGTTLAQIETPRTKRHPHTTTVRLKLRGEALNGAVTAESTYEGFWIYSLPYWTELRRVAGVESGG